MRPFSASPVEMAATCWRNRRLVMALARREVVGRYKGSFLGLFWSFIHPLFMLGIYTFIFSVVFQARWTVESDSRAAFAVILFVGLIVFNLFAECASRAPTLVVAHVNYVKRVVFPLEILPLVTLGSALFHMAISLLVWLIFYVVLFGLPQATLVLFPLVLLPFLLCVLGMSWLLASLGVFLRDLGHVVNVLIPALMFLSAIFYPVDALPEPYRAALMLNPLVLVIEQSRTVLMWGRVPDLRLWSLFLAGGLFVAWLGFACFQKTRKGFADVL